MDKKCPLRFGLKKPACIKHECEWFTHMIGTNPQTGQPTDEWGCAIWWIPLLQTEVAHKTMQTAASVDKVANQIHGLHGSFVKALPNEAKERLTHE